MADKTKVRTRQYEGMFLFGSNAASDLNGAIATVRGMIEKHGGEIIVIKKWDERKLNFEVGKQKRGVYIIVYFNAPTSAITPIDREVRLSEDVLRALITDAEHLNKTEMESVEPQPIIKAEPPAWDRGGGFGGDRPERGDRPPRAPRKEEQPAEAAAKD